MAYRIYTNSEAALGCLASGPTALGGAPKPPAGDEARPPHPLRKAASVSIKGAGNSTLRIAGVEGRSPLTLSYPLT